MLQSTHINKPLLMVIYSRLDLEICLFWSPPGRLSFRLESELDMDLTMLMDFFPMLLSCYFHFFFFFWLAPKSLFASQYFLLSTQTALQILLPTLWLWNGSHNNNNYRTRQEFLLVFCNLDYRYYAQCLYIFLYNSSEHKFFDYFGHDHEILFCKCDKLSDWCMIHSTHLLATVFLLLTGISL